MKRIKTVSALEIELDRTYEINGNVFTVNTTPQMNSEDMVYFTALGGIGVSMSASSALYLLG